MEWGVLGENGDCCTQEPAGKSWGIGGGEGGSRGEGENATKVPNSHIQIKRSRQDSGTFPTLFSFLSFSPLDPTPPLSFSWVGSGERFWGGGPK